MMRYYDMNYGDWGGYGMGFGGGIFCSLIMLVVLVDLVLFGMLLWKKIKRDDKMCCGHDHNHEHKA